jgi:hypothetical protein
MAITQDRVMKGNMSQTTPTVLRGCNGYYARSRDESFTASQVPELPKEVAMAITQDRVMKGS